jgi:hypothetical protein
MTYEELKQEFNQIGFVVFDYNHSEMHCEYKKGNISFYVILDWQTTSFNYEDGKYDYVVMPKKGFWYTDEDPYTENIMQFTDGYTKWITEMIELAYYNSEFLLNFLMRDEDEEREFYLYGI